MKRFLLIIRTTKRKEVIKKLNKPSIGSLVRIFQIMGLGRQLINLRILVRFRISIKVQLKKELKRKKILIKLNSIIRKIQKNL